MRGRHSEIVARQLQKATATRQIALAWLMMLLFAMIGCGSSDVVVVKDDKSAQNLQAIGAAYAKAQFKLGRPPRDVQDMTQLLKDAPGSPEPEQILRSPDDNEPYVIVWNVDFAELARTTGNVDVILAYEQKGRDGKRHVLKPPSMITRLSDEEFRAAKFPPGHQPSP